MTIKVVSSSPVRTRKIVCSNCGYELEFTNADRVRHKTDGYHDPIEEVGWYIVCPRTQCRGRTLTDKDNLVWLTMPAG